MSASTARMIPALTIDYKPPVFRETKTYGDVEFKKLTTQNSITYEQKLEIEKQKLAKMKALQIELLQRNGKKIEEPEAKPKPSKKLIALFGLVVLLYFLPMAAGCFLGMSSILSPVLPKIFAYAGSFAMSSLECVMFYSMIGPLFKKAFGMKPEDQVDPLLQIYEEKLQVTESINKMMTSATNNMSHGCYQKYAAVTKQFNQDVSSIKIEKFKEPTSKKVLRWGATIMNVAQNIGGNYFTATTLLALLSSALVGTPVGWALVGVVVVGGLIGNFAMRSNGMFDMINPRAKRHKEIREKFDKFKNKNEKIDSILNKKKNMAELIKQNAQYKIDHVPIPIPRRTKSLAEEKEVRPFSCIESREVSALEDFRVTRPGSLGS